MKFKKKPTIQFFVLITRLLRKVSFKLLSDFLDFASLDVTVFAYLLPPPPPSNLFWFFQDGSFCCHFTPYMTTEISEIRFCNFRIYNFALNYVINFCLNLQLFKIVLIPVYIFSIEILEKKLFSTYIFAQTSKTLVFFFSFLGQKLKRVHMGCIPNFSKMGLYGMHFKIFQNGSIGDAFRNFPQWVYRGCISKLSKILQNGSIWGECFFQQTQNLI